MSLLVVSTVNQNKRDIYFAYITINNLKNKEIKTVFQIETSRLSVHCRAL